MCDLNITLCVLVNLVSQKVSVVDTLLFHSYLPLKSSDIPVKLRPKIKIKLPQTPEIRPIEPMPR